MVPYSTLLLVHQETNVSSDVPDGRQDVFYPSREVCPFLSHNLYRLSVCQVAFCLSSFVGDTRNYKEEVTHDTVSECLQSLG